MIDLRQADGNGMTWIYHKFKVDGSNQKYRLHTGEAEGPPNGHDAMATIMECFSVHTTTIMTFILLKTVLTITKGLVV